MKVDLELVQQLRQQTGMGILDCKKALEENKIQGVGAYNKKIIQRDKILANKNLPAVLLCFSIFRFPFSSIVSNLDIILE